MIKGGNDCFLQTQFGPKASETISQRRFLPKNKMIPISILKSVRHPYRQQIHLRKIQNWKIMLIIRSLPMQKLAVHPTLNLHLKFFPRPPTALVCPTPPPSCSAVTIVVNFFTHSRRCHCRCCRCRFRICHRRRCRRPSRRCHYRQLRCPLRLRICFCRRHPSRRCHHR